MSEQQQKEKKRVSFSQYSMYSKCPYSWKLNYLEGKRIYEASLNTCFGTAIHHAIQEYIKILYTLGQVDADSLDVFKMFKDKFKEETDKSKEKDNLKFEEDEYTGFVFDGDDILNTFMVTSNRIKHFPSKKYEFIGVELPLELDIKNNIGFIAFIDLVLKDKETGKIKIFDFKTSTLGWNKYQQADQSKIDQVLLYKAFYSKKFNVPLSSIEVEFFILKRKLYENVSFPQSRIQIFSPISTQSVVASTLNEFSNFVGTCFTPEGEYNVNGKYPKIPGKAKKNCKYCSHKGVNCDAKPDILED
jgi:hypothetical protein